MTFLEVLIGFLISLIISGIIIYLATKLLGEKKGFGTALFAALVGSIIYSFVYYFIEIAWIATLIGGIIWLISLSSLYNISWLKSLSIAIVIWLLTTIVSWILPNLTQLL